ncbi:MAG: trypsin-like peptidase domain-containing protein, partial [Candidatus Latescibacterota bacterium]
TWTGSGFIVSEKGYVWTNEHIVRGASEISVSLPNGKEYDAVLVGADHSSDVAVLKIDGKDLPFVWVGDSDDVLIGEWAVAIGNPFGHLISKGDPSVTVGVISARGRDFSPQEGAVYRDMIQTDASINRGNSGGPLANGLGEVIGINTFIMTGSQWEMGSVGIGFAIPINKVRRIAEEIIQYGKVRPFWTGIRIQNLDPLMAQSLGLASASGSLVSEVEKNSPADRAGLKVGDVISGVNGRKVANSEETWQAFREGTVGEVYLVNVIREGAAVVVAIRLEQTP